LLAQYSLCRSRRTTAQTSSWTSWRTLPRTAEDVSNGYFCNSGGRNRENRQGNYFLGFEKYLEGMLEILSQGKAWFREISRRTFIRKIDRKLSGKHFREPL